MRGLEFKSKRLTKRQRKQIRSEARAQSQQAGRDTLTMVEYSNEFGGIHKVAGVSYIGEPAGYGWVRQKPKDPLSPKIFLKISRGLPFIRVSS